MADDEQDNIAQQQEEVVALQSIFPEQFKYDQSTKVCTVLLPDATTPSVEITLCLPPRYPSHDPPSATITGLADAPRAALLQSLHAAFTPGEVVLFTWVDHLLTTPESWQPPAAAPAEPPPAAKPPGPRPPITHGEPVTERKSTFQAHVAPVKRVEEVQSVMASLLAVNKIRSATHNIMAYRIQDPLTGTLMQDCDDDGEDAAGGRLLHLLQVTGAVNVVVVVSRWYGGVLLGPSRFALINNTARQLLEATEHITRGGRG